MSLNFLVNGGDGYPFGELSDPNRVNLYDGQKYGDEEDYPDANLLQDPGLNNSFSETGGEQDAFAEYMLAFHGNVNQAYDEAELDAGDDRRIRSLSLNPISADAQTAGARQTGACPID